MQIVGWCYEIVDQCRFDRDTVAVAMNLADRFMSTPEAQAQGILHHRGQYQLVAVTALYISIKLNESTVIGSRYFEALSKGVYSKEDIESMEWMMLESLSWRLNPPTSLQVSDHMLSLMLCHIQKTTSAPSLQEGTWNFVHEEVAYQIQNSIREYYFTSQRPSTIATAAILNVIYQVVEDQDCKTLILALVYVLQEFVEKLDSSHRVREVMDRLQSIVNNEDSSEDDISITTLPAEANSPEISSTVSLATVCIGRRASISNVSEDIYQEYIDHMNMNLVNGIVGK